MDPILSTELAAAHRAELLRVAETHRRTATGHGSALLDGLAGRARELVAHLRRPAAVQSPVACCA